MLSETRKFFRGRKCRGLRFSDKNLETVKRVIKKKTIQQFDITKMVFGFMPGLGTANGILNLLKR